MINESFSETYNDESSNGYQGVEPFNLITQFPQAFFTRI